MAVSIAKLVKWFDDRKGKLTYSMTGSRTGADGTADCSGSVCEALYNASGVKYDYLYSTVTISEYLKKLGYHLVASGGMSAQNASAKTKAGDIVMYSNGNSMADSAGAGGHIGVMKTDSVFISTDYSKKGAQGQAVQEYQLSYYFVGSRYVEIWRVGGDGGTIMPSTPTNLVVDGFGLYQDGKTVTETVKALQRVLGISADGILSKPSNAIKELQKFLNSKGNNLEVDGWLGKATITALQKYLGTTPDGVISQPSNMVKALQTRLNTGKL